jgi:hypothetical protein
MTSSIGAAPWGKNRITARSFTQCGDSRPRFFARTSPIPDRRDQARPLSARDRNVFATGCASGTHDVLAGRTRTVCNGLSLNEQRRHAP